MPSLAKTLLPALLLTTAGCGDLLFLEVEQPSICKTLEQQAFSGSEYSTTIDINVSQELQGLGVQSPQGLDVFISLQRARLTARDGISNFDFIDAARIAVVPVTPNGPPPAEVLSYTRTRPTGAEVELHQERDNVNLSDYITQDTLRLEASLTGRLPSEDWSIDIQVCLYARARVRYLELLPTGP
jgi:hypothetical protein